MATYDFFTIDPRIAPNITSADQLTFSSGTATDVTVIYVSSSDIQITLDGRTVDFGPAVAAMSQGQPAGAFMFADGSLLFIGDDGNNRFVQGAVDRNEAVFGGAGDDTLEAGDGINLIQGNAGNDSIMSGMDLHDTIYGGQGDDYIGLGIAPRNGDIGGGFAQGNKGNDQIVGASDSPDTLLGGQGDDTIDGGGGNAADFLNGNLGNDLIKADGNNDQAFGEGGNDTLQGYANSLQVVSHTLHGGDGNDVLIGYVLKDPFNQQFGARNSLWGDAGDDSLVSSSPQPDDLHGGDGNDTLSTDGANGGDTLMGDAGNDSLLANATGDVLQGGSGNDYITDNFGNSSIDGGDGNDTIFYFGFRPETITGGAGDDTIYADRSGSPMSIDGGDGNDQIQIGTAQRSTITGGAGDDFVNGNGAGNFIDGGDGNDLLQDGATSTLNGGLGDDTLSGGVMSGGPGANVFELGVAASSESGDFRILDWTSQDRIQVHGLSIGGLNYQETTAADYASALALLPNGTPAQGVVAVQVGADVVVLTSENASGPGNMHAVILVGRTLADIDASNIVG